MNQQFRNFKTVKAKFFDYLLDKPWRAGLFGIAFVGLTVLIKFAVLPHHPGPDLGDYEFGIFAFAWLTFVAMQKRKNAYWLHRFLFKGDVDEEG